VSLTPSLKSEHQNYLTELKLWMPWVFQRGDAYASLKNEFPSLTEAEAKAIVAQFEAAGPQLLQEETTDDPYFGDSWHGS
jgi:hypothetical protein